MSAGARLAVDGDCMRVSGELDFATVIPLQPEGDQWLRTQAPAACRLDLGDVTRSNSAATALLLAWLRTAAAAGKTLRVENVPEPLRGLLHLASLDLLLEEPGRRGVASRSSG